MNNYENNTFVSVVRNGKLIERHNTTKEAIDELLLYVGEEYGDSVEYNTVRDFYSPEITIRGQVREFNRYIRGRGLPHYMLAVTEIP